MGSAFSSAPDGRADAVGSESETMSGAGSSTDNKDVRSNEEFHDADDGSEDTPRDKAKAEALMEFKNELDIKREQRKAILARHRTEKEDLEKALLLERKNKLSLCESNILLRDLLIKNGIEIPEELNSAKENDEVTNVINVMSEELEKLKDNNIKLRRDLSEANNNLQGAYSDIADLHAQQSESMKHVHALKEVISVSKTMIGLREQQLEALKNKLNEIEQSLADREASMLSSDLREEYERQLQNIRTLRSLYEERARLAEVTRQGLIRELEEQKAYNQIEINKSNELKTQIENLQTELSNLKETIENKNDQINSCTEESRGLQVEMSTINKLFSQVLLGYKNKKDLDKLVHRLEENHGLLTQMAEKENGSEVSSALPKLLLELVSQVDEGADEHKNDVNDDVENVDASSSGLETKTTSVEERSNSPTNTTAEEIVENLPKVWRVLMELLSHQNVPDTNVPEKVTTCYKSVETKSGPVLVPSVSQTYIRLKDLIVEKLSLIKEVNRMKQLNTHLETRLGEQENRLCLVTTELSKTWHVVGRLRRHHHQLHTHEKILKYELQQKRKLLNELKEELEYCREKWDQAREKNTQTEKDCKKLRAEFSSRKTKSISTSCHNSAESGYSDERPSDDSSDSNEENEPLVHSKKKMAKSFETIHDSSTDVHVAEREDPVSDMIDVADLSLDTQDGDEHQDTSFSECCNSEDKLKGENHVAETDDETADIDNEICPDNLSVVEDENQASTSRGNESPTVCNNSNIDTVAILQSIRQQNERLVKKDKKLKALEKSGDALLKQTQNTVKLGESLNSTLDHLLNRPVSTHNEVITINSESRSSTTIIEKHDSKDIQIQSDLCEQLIIGDDDSVNEVVELSNRNDCDDRTSNMITPNLIKDTDDLVATCSASNVPQPLITLPRLDPKTILENVRRQDERLARKDKRLNDLEAGCSNVCKTLANTLNSGDHLIQKIDAIHKESDNTEDSSDEISQSESLPSEAEASTSTNEIDHEARFAARDIRLKRLEEQTKSLVNKMTKTKSKGVKINYKLEELHNIYGSESSRAGTPSEPTENDTVGPETDTVESVQETIGSGHETVSSEPGVDGNENEEFGE